jgi:hypothetical protein
MKLTGREYIVVLSIRENFQVALNVSLYNNILKHEGFTLISFGTFLGYMVAREQSGLPFT